MPLACEDLARYGVVLIPPSTVEYFKLLADTEHRLQVRPKGSPPVESETLIRISEHDTSGSAILLNRARVSIASLAYIWSFRGRNDRVVPHSFHPGTNPSVLLPFGLNERNRKFHAFWNTIFPGSKRLMTAEGAMFGDNTDVHPPAPDELWHGGFISFGRGSRSEQLEPLKLTLDGVFFVDGGFAGPNRLGSWEQTTSTAETYLACAALARKARQNGTRPADFFAQVQQLTGLDDQARNPAIKRLLDATEAHGSDAQGRSELPPPPPPIPPPPSNFSEAGRPGPEPIRKHEQQVVGWQVFRMRQAMGEEAAIARIESWADAPVPRFHKL